MYACEKGVEQKEGMAVSFTYIKDAYLFSKRTLVYPGLVETVAQAGELAPIWTVERADGRAYALHRSGSGGGPVVVVMTMQAEGARRDQARFGYRGQTMAGGFDLARLTWAFVGFDGRRYDWVAGMMQHCWKLEDDQGATIAQYIGMAPDYKIRGSVSVYIEKVTEALIALIHLSATLLRYAPRDAR
ncbi:hypothetical protein H4R18_001617 [Coemansia javaensis]|uniref:Uncharacterized protein n=1 Tax=Coemansia javaensis TaxID=2761396 RepID=A0A9W8HEF0_9FUNG|nr:hypothetical protein H4R18_001617 [Coemansia javaensis]